ISAKPPNFVPTQLTFTASLPTHSLSWETRKMLSGSLLKRSDSGRKALPGSVLQVTKAGSADPHRFTIGKIVLAFRHTLHKNRLLAPSARGSTFVISYCCWRHWILGSAK